MTDIHIQSLDVFNSQSDADPAPAPRAGRPVAVIFVVLVALIALSISVRAQQVQRVLHSSVHTTMGTKTNRPAPAVAETVPTQQATFLPPPVVPTESSASSNRDTLPTLQRLWYCVSVRHRPPPHFLA